MDNNLFLAAINTVVEARFYGNAKEGFIFALSMVAGFFGAIAGVSMLFLGQKPIVAIFVVSASISIFGTGIHLAYEYESRGATAFWEELRSSEDCSIVAEGLANRSVRMPDHTALALQRRCGIPAAEFVEIN